MTAQTSWKVPPPSMDLKPRQVDLWRAQVDVEPGVLAEFQSSLSAEEESRANRFHFSRDRSRFVVSRGVLRVLLSIYLRIPPAAVKLATDDNGKPFVLADQHSTSVTPIRFNTTHSETWAVFAFSRDLELGIDIEYFQREVDYEAILERHFSDVERTQLRALSPDARRQAFFRIWTRKEACLKATGEGLRTDLDSFSVPLELDIKQCISLTIHGLSKSAMYSFSPAPDYEGALVVEGSGHDLHFWTWKHELGRNSRVKE